MAKSNFIDIQGKKIELIYSLWAMDELGKISGKSVIIEWFKPDAENASDVTFANRVFQAIEILANAAIIKNNASISFGLESGEKQEKFEDGCLVSILEAISTPVETVNYFKAVIDTISKGTDVKIPKELQADIDEDLLEIEAEKKRN